MEGRTQKISVTSTPPGAACVFKQADTVVGRVTTPGSAEVSKTKNDLVILCSKPGYETVTVNNHSDLSLASLGNMVFGNYSFLGNAVDSASGATNKYDSNVSIALAPAQTPTAFPPPPGLPPVIKMAPEIATSMSMQVPMPAAPVAPVSSAPLPPPVPAAIAAAPSVASGASPSLSAAEALARAALRVPNPDDLARRDYAQAIADSPRRPPFNVEQ